jgi:hypothetical protein
MIRVRPLVLAEARLADEVLCVHACVLAYIHLSAVVHVSRLGVLCVLLTL